MRNRPRAITTLFLFVVVGNFRFSKLQEAPGRIIRRGGCWHSREVSKLQGTRRTTTCCGVLIREVGAMKKCQMNAVERCLNGSYGTEVAVTVRRIHN